MSLSWLALLRLPGLGRRRLLSWWADLPDAEAIWQGPARQSFGAAERDAAWAAGQRDLEAAQRCGARVLTWADADYPAALRQLPDPPAALFVRGWPAGNAAPWPERAVALVGSRRATAYGQRAANQIAADLALAGVTVISGLARGIDAHAHRGALRAAAATGWQAGAAVPTLAVLGCGPDVVYPRENAALLAEMLERGCPVVSEYPPGTEPLAHHFPQRNRLVSGLAAALVVVEAAEQSGTLITVDCALEQGREVFAVPGSIFALQSRGTHRLLRQGAQLCTCAADVLEELGWSLSERQSGAATTAAGRAGAPCGAVEVAGEPGQVWAQLAADAAAPSGDTSGLTPDDLCQRTGLSAEAVSAALLVLELRGLARRDAAGRYHSV